MECETCAYYAYDEEDDAYYCTTCMDQDDAGRLSEGHWKGCPFWRDGDEYALVKHQL